MQIIINPKQAEILLTKLNVPLKADAEGIAVYELYKLISSAYQTETGNTFQPECTNC